MIPTFDLDLLRCPSCGEAATVHVDAVTVVAADGSGYQLTATGEDDTSRVRVDPLTGQPSPGRRHAVTLHGWCEAGPCAFVVTFTQHKGQTVVAAAGAVDLTATNPTPGEQDLVPVGWSPYRGPAEEPAP